MSNIQKFLAELKRRNVYRLGAIYVVAAWLILQVAAILLPAFETPPWVMKSLIYGLAIGFPIALILSWIFELTPEGIKKSVDLVEEDQPPEFEIKKKRDLKRWTIGVLAITVIILLVNVIWQKRENQQILTNQDNQYAPGPPSLAVLAFANMSADRNQEYFAEGLSEELINLFVKIPDLHVISRSSSFSFKGKNETIPNIGKALGADYILEGSVRPADEKVRITAQLIRVRDDVHLFSKTYDRVLNDILKVQDEIARQVYKTLELKIEQEKMPLSIATNPEAYQLFLKAKYEIHNSSVESLNNAETLLKAALELDPEFVAAYDKLGELYEKKAAYGIMPTDEGLELSRQYIDKALALDSNYVSAYYGLMQIALGYEWDFDKLNEYIKKIEQIQPTDYNLLSAKASYEFIYGNFDKAIDLYQEELTYDPVAVNTFKHLGMSYFYKGDIEKAQNHFEKALQISPKSFSSNYYMGLTYLFLDSLDRAHSFFKLEDFDGYQDMGQSMILSQQGDRQGSDTIIQRIKSNYAFVMPFQIAEIYAFRNDIDSAFTWLDHAYNYKDGGVIEMVGDPLLKNLHADPRWEAFLRRMNLIKD